MQRVISTLCAVLILGAYSPAAIAMAPSVPSFSPQQNLLAAMRLWGDVDFFDPALDGGGINWDMAFLRAEPAIAAAKDKMQYVAAITMMLAPLHDPATGVIRSGDASSIGQRIIATALAGATLITVPHGLTTDESAVANDASSAVAIAAGGEIVAIDLRGVTESSTGDASALHYLFSKASPLLALVNGSFALPRELTRAYSGYPGQTQGSFTGYFAQDSVADAKMLTGTSIIKHRFVFLVDGHTSLPSMALGLVAAGQGAIYSTGGDPSILAPSTGEIDLPYGIKAALRTADLADISQPLDLPRASDPAQAITKFIGMPPGPPATPVDRNAAHVLKDEPYAADPFPDQPKRMLAVARIYNVIRYFSPYTNLMHDDWDAAAIRAISDERVAGDTRSYLLGLMRFYSHLHDSHGYIGGHLMNSEFGAGLPFQARYLHRKVVVTNVESGYPAVANLRVGDIIDSVNGVAVRRAMDEAEVYVSASTPQAADAAALSSSYQHSVFTGRKNTSVTIVFHRASGDRRTLTITRDYYGSPPVRTGAKYFVLPGNVGYVDFDRLEPAETDAMFETLKGTRAIIFDDRGYPKGAVLTVAPRLATSSYVRAALFDTPNVTRPLEVTSYDIQPLPSFVHFYQLVPPSTDWKYLKPTVMLIDERSISQAEHSALFFRQAAGTRFVGTPTDGADGDVTSMVVPGAVYLNFTGEGVRWPNGDQLQRMGVQPDVRVEPDAVDVAAGNDLVLQKGLDEALRLAGASRAERSTAVKRETVREHAAFKAGPNALPFAMKGSNARPLALEWSAKTPGYRGWTGPGSGYAESAELSVASLNDSADGAASFGSYAAQLDITEYRGKTVRIRGYLSTEAVSGGAGFWLRIDGPSPQFDNMHDRWLTGTSGWKPFAIVLRVPVSATQAVTGLLLVGTGTAHASALTIDVVPDTTPVTGS